mgnify:CR=1 FL=1
MLQKIPFGAGFTLPAALLAIAGVAVCAPPSAPVGQMVITVESRSGHSPAGLHPEDVMAYSGKTRVPVTDLQKLDGEHAGMQFFILLDDAAATSALGVHLPELRDFVKSLPATTEVAIGYMRSGGFDLVQGFTTDHTQAAATLRLPGSVAGGNGSPYFALSYLAKHWPSQEETGRRAVLMLTDGIDRYYTNDSLDDPYVNAAIRDVQKRAIGVYSIYLRGAGMYPGGGWAVNVGQSRLLQVTDQTGGRTYYEGLNNPVSLAPFLEDLDDRLANQYKITLATAARGPQAIKLRTEVPGLKITGPARIYAE